MYACWFLWHIYRLYPGQNGWNNAVCQRKKIDGDGFICRKTSAVKRIWLRRKRCVFCDHLCERQKADIVQIPVGQGEAPALRYQILCVCINPWQPGYATNRNISGNCSKHLTTTTLSVATGLRGDLAIPWKQSHKMVTRPIVCKIKCDNGYPLSHFLRLHTHCE